MKRQRFIAAAAAAAAGGVATRARAQIIPEQPIQIPQQYLQQLTIAVNVTLSGPLQKYGQEVVKGVQAAVDETNRFNAPDLARLGLASHSTIATIRGSPPPTPTSPPPILRSSGCRKPDRADDACRALALRKRRLPRYRSDRYGRCRNQTRLSQRIPAARQR